MLDEDGGSFKFKLAEFLELLIVTFLVFYFLGFLLVISIGIID